MTTDIPQRPRFPNRVRLLLAAAAVLAVPVGWLAVQLFEAKRERDAAAEIEDLGVEVGWSEPTGPVWLWNLLGDDLIDGRHVNSVQLIGNKGTDASLRHLKAFDQVQMLDLTGSEITDAGLENLKGLDQLQSLWLCGTQITSEGLKNLKGLSNLQDLNLARTKITDDGLEHLQGLRQLQTLALMDTQVTEGGIKKPSRPCRTARSS